jgi:two-component system sensor histidine kinase KdpD
VLKEVGFDEVVPAALYTTRSGGAAGGVADVVVEVPDSLPRVKADAGLLERAIANVVANALHASPVDRPVRIVASAVLDRVELRVVDQGPGIPPGQRARVFQPFQRLGDRPNGTGVGLGLAVARGFVEAMGGELTIEDTPGGGTTMVVSLPAAMNGA